VRVVGTACKANSAFVGQFGGTPVEYGPGLLERVRAVAPRVFPPRWARSAATRLMTSRLPSCLTASGSSPLRPRLAPKRTGKSSSAPRTRKRPLPRPGALSHPRARPDRCSPVPISKTFKFDDAPAAFAMLTGRHPRKDRTDQQGLTDCRRDNDDDRTTTHRGKGRSPRSATAA
jgi:hypothetical protein